MNFCDMAVVKSSLCLINFYSAILQLHNCMLSGQSEWKKGLIIVVILYYWGKQVLNGEKSGSLFGGKDKGCHSRVPKTYIYLLQYKDSVWLQSTFLPPHPRLPLSSIINQLSFLFETEFSIFYVSRLKPIISNSTVQCTNQVAPSCKRKLLNPETLSTKTKFVIK